MNNIHSSHGTSSIVEDPLLVQVDVAPRKLLAQLIGDEGDDSSGIITMGPNGAQREIVKVCWVQDVERLKVRVQVFEQDRQEREDNREDGCFLSEGARASSRS